MIAGSSEGGSPAARATATWLAVATIAITIDILCIHLMPRAALIRASEQSTFLIQGVENPGRRKCERHEGAWGSYLSPVLATVRAPKESLFDCRVHVFRLSWIIGDAASFAPEFPGILPKAEAIHDALNALGRCGEQPARLHAPRHVRRDDLSYSLTR